MRDEASSPASSLSPHPSSLFFLAVALLFLAARLPLLAARDPFFDELFTQWMARQPIAHVIPNLLHDSGPPLYYFLARFDSITALRLLSLLFATIQFVLVARRSLIAGLLIALYPPAALLSVDARSYALCALFVTIGLLAENGWASALSLVVAAYAHYYGVLFFPILLFRKQFREFGLAILFFIPGFLLASRQPVEAMRWNREPFYAPFLNVSFAGSYPYALFAGVPIAAALIATVLLGVAAGFSRRAEARRYMLAVLIPFALVLLSRVYFPMRFEALIAAPLALWLADSFAGWRRAVIVALAIAGAGSIAYGIVDHQQRPMDSYRQAALVLRDRTKPSDVVVASGYLYLEAIAALNRPIVAWPAEQAIHPGWRANDAPDPKALPTVPFVWIGERYAPELRPLGGVKSVTPLFFNERALVAQVTNLTRPLH